MAFLFTCPILPDRRLIPENSLARGRRASRFRLNGCEESVFWPPFRGRLALVPKNRAVFRARSLWIQTQSSGTDPNEAWDDLEAGSSPAIDPGMGRFSRDS